MRILVDGDGCSIVPILYNYKDIDIRVYIDYSHNLESDAFEVIYCPTGKDSVDMYISNDVQKGDLVITSDIGLSSIVIGKGAMVLNQDGKIIDAHNIDQLMFERYLGVKNRKHKKYTYHPKRTEKQDEDFINALHIIIGEK